MALVNHNPSLPSFSSFITVKLSQDNFPLWKAQVSPYLKAHGLFSFADGSNPCPPPVPNDELNGPYRDWQSRDQLVIAILTSSLTESILAQVIDCNTSTQIWSNLYDLFSARSSAHIVHTRIQLASLKKGSETVSEFFNRGKSLSTMLAAADQGIFDTEFATYLLAELTSDYDSIVTSLSTQPILPTPKSNPLSPACSWVKNIAPNQNPHRLHLCKQYL